MSLNRQLIRLSLCVVLFFGFALWFVLGAERSGNLSAPSRLRCEYASNPLGIDVRRPRFSWVLEHTERGQKQSAFQLLVATRPSLLDRNRGDHWDSGKAASQQSTQVVYQGKPLESGKTYYWKIRFWDRQGKTSPYSQKAHFEMALLSPQDWKGRWIGGNDLLRKEFTLAGRVVRARAYISALGYYELRVNGEKLGKNVLDPGWTTYEKRVLYATYDVTPHLRQGANSAGVMLGGGWATLGGNFSARIDAPFESPAFLLQIDVELEGGKQLSLVSDTSWKTARGPMVSNHVFDGEVYDARREQPGWDGAGFDDSNWARAEAAIGPKGILSVQMMESIQMVDTLVPVKMANPRPGIYVFDMGQNFSGWAQLRVRGPRGTKVTLRFAELVYDDEMINRENIRRAKARDIYILRGGGAEIYEPRFTYHGFRYVEVTGFPATPTLNSLRGRVVHTAVQPAGGFACSNPLLNQIQKIILWSLKSNLHSVPTDCPQRDERMGWLGDAHLTAEAAMLNFHMSRFYSNFIRDIRDAQDSSTGTLSDTVPHRYGSRPADPAWGTAYPLLCWYMYEQYGDRRILEENYDGLKKYVEFLRSRTQDHIVNYSYYGDWVAIEKTPGKYISTCFYYSDVQLLSKIAEILGRAEDARSYSQLAVQIKEALNRKYLDPETGYYANGSQTANAFALFLGLVPQERHGQVVRNLVENIVYVHDTHLSTGIMGTKSIMDVLSTQGRSDLAYELASQTSYPSWGYMIANGATTLWELWQYRTGPSMNSHNHPMFGSVSSWFYKVLAGINVDSGTPAYRRIRIRPHVVRDLRWASGSVETLRGTVASSWTHWEGKVTLEVVIPVNSEAEISVPKAGMNEIVVREGGQVVWEDGQYRPGVPGLAGAAEENHYVTFQAGSGRYSFTAAST